MEANELMIGDWVQGFVPDSYSKIYGVFNEQRVAVIAEPTKAYIELSIDDIQPIPLTPEILEKNGFERRDDLCKRMDDALPFILDINEIDSVIVEWRDSFDNGLSDENAESWGEYWSLLVSGMNYHFKKTADRIYIHDLQHALRLCGIDKEIVV